jgi:hypothetical protein
MSDPHPDTPALPIANQTGGTTPTAPEHSGLLRTGGVLGIAACATGLLVFLGACVGFEGALSFSVVPVALSAPGLLLALAGAVFQRRAVTEDTHVLQAVFVNLFGLVGGLMELAVHRGWPIFHK